MTCLRLFICALISAGGVSEVLAENWPGWRGPHSDGTSSESGFPIKWSATDNVTWKTPIPGTGHSSPVVWNDRVFLTACDEQTKERLLLCLDRDDGTIRWQRVVVTSTLEPKHRLNSYASSTAVTDGTHVWVTFFEQPDVRVACYDMDGKQIWMTSPGEFHSKHGFCSPPVLYKNLVIINGDQDADAYIVALKQDTGKEVWRANRPNKTRSYCPPIVIDVEGQKQLVLSGSKCVASYDPDTGKQIWIIDGPTEQFVASLVYKDGLLCMTAGYPTYHIMAIDPRGKGDVTDTHVIWHTTQGAAYVPSPVAWEDNFFVVSDKGICSCLGIRDGERYWKERLGRSHSASPVVSDGILYFPDDHGITHVLKAGRNFEVIARNDLGEDLYASPALSEGQIFLRGTKHLYCIGTRK